VNYFEILNIPSCQIYSDPVAVSHNSASVKPFISIDDVSDAIQSLNAGISVVTVHSNLFKFSGVGFKFIGKVSQQLPCT